MTHPGDNDFTLNGYRVLRFPAFVVRYNPGYVAGNANRVTIGRSQTGISPRQWVGKTGGDNGR
jgi:hypothetical protein